jgi:hypothetical protein
MTGFQSKKAAASAKDQQDQKAHRVFKEMLASRDQKAIEATKVFDREEAIDYLSESDFQYIINGDCLGLDLLRSYLEDGFKGYGNFTDAELIAEVAQRKEMENA